MKEKAPKYSFWILSGLLLILLAGLSRNAGITCDEVLHYNHSISVYNYFASHGRDLSSLDTPESNLKYYGQSYDNLVTIITKWLNIDDVYAFRNFMSAIAGWLAIVVTGLFAIWLAGYGAGITVIVLFAVSPTFLGHSLNNLKDIPFALAYISALFFTLKFIFSKRGKSIPNTVLLTLSIAAAISIRAGGLILVCYLFFFFILFYLFKYLEDGKISPREIGTGILIISSVSVISFFISILLWPYALQHPLKNVIASYKVMAHFPSTFRQIFEGKEEWSDYMPWYYLPESMAVTIPLLVTSGLLIFTIFIRKIIHSEAVVKYAMVVFTILFPVVFVIVEDSNLYSSWRQFLFIYPGIILISALGFTWFFRTITNRYIKLLLISVVILLTIHPLRFMISNPKYWYIYYNQFAGGLKGAYGNYETDYYYVSQTEASEWLLKYLIQKGDTNNVRVNATYSVQWSFRQYSGIKTSYFRFEERSLYDWDYAIIANRYIPPFKLKNKLWPPENAIHTVYADSVPLCVVLDRKYRSDFYGYEALKDGRIKESIVFFEDALGKNDKDEMIFYNFAAALVKDGQKERAYSMLKEGLKLNPDCDFILMYLANLSKSENRIDDAREYYEKLISVNRKYFEAYIELSGIYEKEDVFKSRELLRRCLIINPGYKPAIIALADTYRDSDPGIAEKYYELARETD